MTRCHCRRCAGADLVAPASAAGPDAPWRWPLAAALALASAGAMAAPEGGASARYPITPEQSSVAERVAQRGVPLSELAPGAPERHVVKVGDTLWALAGQYLRSPWRWPELWGMNRAEVHNPHLIYPGQTLVLLRSADGRAQLSVEGAATAGAATAAAGGLETVKLHPQVRDLGSGTLAAIPSIPNTAIEPFLSQPMVVAANELDSYPRVIATPEDRVFLGHGDLAYVRGIEGSADEDFHLFRAATPLYDPDDTERRHPIAYEAYFLGSARVVQRGAVTTVRIEDSREEVGVGDRLVAIRRQQLITYVPHRPEQPIAGRIIAVYGGVNAAGAESVVTLDRGQADGLEVGHVLAVLRNGRTVVDRTSPGRESIKLPDSAIGQLFVFRVSAHVSYALVVAASGPIEIGDRIAPPDYALARPLAASR